MLDYVFVLDVRRRLRAILYGTILAMGAVGVMACPIPVYQYALEHWESDPYVVSVSHDGSLHDDARMALERLRLAAEGEGLSVNLELREAVTADATAEPQIEVRYPETARIRQPVWRGMLTREAVEELLHSPIRTRLTNALIARTSVVWLLLESGDKTADRAARQLLADQIERLAKEIMVPESADWGGETVTIDHNHYHPIGGQRDLE